MVFLREKRKAGLGQAYGQCKTAARSSKLHPNDALEHEHRRSKNTMLRGTLCQGIDNARPASCYKAPFGLLASLALGNPVWNTASRTALWKDMEGKGATASVGAARSTGTWFMELKQPSAEQKAGSERAVTDSNQAIGFSIKPLQFQVCNSALVQFTLQ